MDRWIRRITRMTLSRTSCSQTRITFHPSFFNSRSTRRSRRELRSNLARQKHAFDFGIDPCFGHPCQKQPSTKIAILGSDRTMSGVPGRGGSFASRKRISALRSSVRSAISGAVPDRRTRDINCDRIGDVGRRSRRVSMRSIQLLEDPVKLVSFGRPFQILIISGTRASDQCFVLNDSAIK